MGRPRTFDKEEALERALEVFWRKGFEGASLCDLTEAMGINPPSLYAAFGNKEELFLQALDRYQEERGAFWSEAASAPSAREAMERMLRGTAEFLTDKHNPRGCLMVQGALTCGETADAIRQELNKRRAAGQKAVRERFERAKAEGDLPAGIEPADLARFVSTVVEGMAVQAAAGASRKDLKRVVGLAMRVWPD
jgi:AcrR family transcriptional regulator